jgi:ssDNA-specific exonuclease RecJ
MKITTALNKKENIRIHTLSGKFNFDELYNALYDLYNDPGFDLKLNSLWDVRNVDATNIVSTYQIEKIVRFVSQKRGSKQTIKIAVVVSKKFDFGLARMYEQKQESVSDNEIQVFTDINKSIEWIKS